MKITISSALTNAWQLPTFYLNNEVPLSILAALFTALNQYEAQGLGKVNVDMRGFAVDGYQYQREQGIEFSTSTAPDPNETL
jgi:hypothetical protein